MSEDIPSAPAAVLAEPVRFADGKDEGALRTIGEVAAALGIRPHVLRYWEEQFPSLTPLKRSGGRRYYRPGDVAQIELIDRLVHREGYTLKGARQALRRGADKPPPAAIHQPAETAPAHTRSAPPAALRAGLVAVRTALAQALHES